MTTDERLDSLARSVADLERVTRQGFQVLTELHADTERAMKDAVVRLENGLSYLMQVVAAS